MSLKVNSLNIQYIKNSIRYLTDSPIINYIITLFMAGIIELLQLRYVIYCYCHVF